MSNLTLDQKQNRLTNILLAGNLYKSHQISKSINSLVGSQNQLVRQGQAQHQQVMGVIKNTERAVNSQLKILSEIEKRKILKNVFFEINEELEYLIKNKKYTNVEAFCKFNTLTNLLEKNQIGPSITDDLDEKKYIKETIKKLNDENNKVIKNLSKNDIKDLEEMYEILSNDEEYEIHQLKHSIDLVTGEISLKLKDYYEKLIKSNKGVGLLGFLEVGKNVLTTQEYHQENKKDLRNGGISGPIFSWDKSKLYTLRLGIENLGSIFPNSNLMYRLVKERLDLKKFYKEISILDAPTYAYAGIDFEKFLNDGEKTKFSLFSHFTSISDSIFSKATSTIKKVVIDREKIKFGFSKKTKDDKTNGVAGKLYERYEKIINHLNKYVESALTNAFPEDEKKAKLIKIKIKKLEETVDEEKNKVKSLIKKHPFVSTLVTNRLSDEDLEKSFYL